MTRLLVTGIGSFTGGHLVDHLRGEDIEIFGLAQREEALRPGVAAQYVADLNDFDRLKSVVRQVKPDLVVHLAGIAFVGRSDFEAFYRTNLIGSRNLLEALSSLDHAPAGVLIASSANVYGNLRPGAISETMHPNPVNDYGVSKLSMEYAAALSAAVLPTIIARPFNYTGVGQSTDFLLPKIVDHLKRKADHINLGNIDVARDFSDVRDVARIYMELLRNPAARGQTVNICSGRAYALREILAMAQEAAGHVIDVRVDPKLVRPNEIDALWGDRSKLESLLSNRDIISLSETIDWMLRSN